jgi:hypothetical protein
MQARARGLWALRGFWCVRPSSPLRWGGGAGAALAGLVQWGLTRERAGSCAVPPAFIRHFGAVVWGQALLFGMIHLGNYAAFASPWGLAVVLPQVLGGVVLAYVRTRAGLRLAMGYHAAHNAGWLLAAYLLG